MPASTQFGRTAYPRPGACNSTGNAREELRAADTVTVVSEHQARLVRARPGADRVRVIHNRMRYEINGGHSLPALHRRRPRMTSYSWEACLRSRVSSCCCARPTSYGRTGGEVGCYWRGERLTIRVLRPAAGCAGNEDARLGCASRSLPAGTFGWPLPARCRLLFFIPDRCLSLYVS